MVRTPSGPRLRRSLGISALSAIAALAPGLAILGEAGPAMAEPVNLECNQTLGAESTGKTLQLQNDVGPCPPGDGNNGILIDADNVTLDLNGHTISGTQGVVNDGAGVAVVGDEQSGTGHRKVFITNGSSSPGTIRWFDAGVVITGGLQNGVSNLEIVDNVGGGPNNLGDGIVVDASIHNTIQQNHVAGNGPYSGITILSTAQERGVSHHNFITNNVVEDNNIGVPATPDAGQSQDVGIRVELYSRDNEIVTNTVRRNGLDGIELFQQTFNNTVSGNTVTDNGSPYNRRRKGDGIDAAPTSYSNKIDDNRSTGNAGFGIYMGGTTSSITDNTATGNGQYDAGDADPNCDQNEWRGNTFVTVQRPCISATARDLNLGRVRRGGQDRPHGPLGHLPRSPRNPRPPAQV